MADAAAAASNGLINDFGSIAEFGNVGTIALGSSVGWSVAADCDAVAPASIKSSSSFGTNPNDGRYSSGNTEK